MNLRSKVVLRVRDALIVAAEEGYGLRVEELKRLIPRGRELAGVIWELRRWGGETIAVKQGKIIVGYVLRADVPEDAEKMDDPAPQQSVPYDSSIFRPVAYKRKTPKAFTPSETLTKAAQKLLTAA